MRKSLTKSERIHKKQDIRNVFRHSRRIEREGLVIRCRENGMNYNRVCISLRRGFKNAVKRNRAKRILREIYRTNKYQMKQGFDLVFILSPGEYSFFELEKKVLALLQSNNQLEHEGE
ncbi:MAG: ribonuclease P protein component [Spirochaetales bacterium]|nr:ribonuclease P protein component [Spirochaetales bacterium]